MFLLQVGARFCNLVALWVIARPLAMPSNISSVLLIYAAMAASDYVVMLIPAKIGVSEGATFFLFRLLGLDPALGLIIGVVARLRGIFSQAPFALAAYWVTHGHPVKGAPPPEAVAPPPADGGTPPVDGQASAEPRHD
jgi:uncharacterized membrane protein YbhN (UPF0104 family)